MPSTIPPTFGKTALVSSTLLHDREEHLVSEDIVSLSVGDKERKLFLSDMNKFEDIVSLSVDDKERKLFLSDINKFMAEIGKPFSKIPIMGYKELDLFQLFREVISYGGFIEVVKTVGTWSKIWKRLGNFDPSITDSSFRLKKNYERYLLEYEYKCFPEHRQQAAELEKQQQLKKAQQLSGESTKTEPKKSSPKIEPKIKTKKSTKRKTFPACKDIVREKSGAPKMPLLLGELTVHSLGSVIPQAPYISDKHIWPVGFCSSRYFTSMKNKDMRVRYTSQIIDGQNKPQFMVTADDDPTNPIISHSPSGAWREVLKRMMCQDKTSTEDISQNISVSGTLRFGLAHPIVAHFIRELPESEKCRVAALLCTPNTQNVVVHKKKRRQPASDSSDSGEQTPPPSRKRGRMSQDGSSDDMTPENFVFEELEVDSAVDILFALKNCLME